MPGLGSLVSFRICDVYLPEAGDLLQELTAENVMLGRVIEFSDCGTARDIFAVVELRQGQTVIVAVNKLNPADDEKAPV